MKQQRIAFFPGSFNPFTIGHLSVVNRAAALFDKIIIAIGINESKHTAESVQSRIDAIEKVVAGIDGVEVSSYSGLTVDACRKHGAGFILRGVRSVTDFEYEQHMADINRRIAGIETVVIFTLPEHSAISSSVVRELGSFGYDTKEFLP